VIGSAGFLVLASSQYAWVFILGIVVFSVGEMTCHPKYYSYIGLVAPEDKKAVYMGYAFLYGVIGSLFGMNVGGEMYNAILDPLKGRTDVAGTLRNFWLVFAVLGVVTSFVLLLYNKWFAENTAATRALARKAMFAVYTVLVLGAGAVLYLVWNTQGAITPKTWIQAGILTAMGVGGLLILLRTRDAT
jgi:hypothetical protein